MRKTKAQRALLQKWRDNMANRVYRKTTGTLHRVTPEGTSEFCAQGCLIDTALKEGFLAGHWVGSQFYLDNYGGRIGGYLDADQAPIFGLTYGQAKRIERLNDENRQDPDFDRIVRYLDTEVIKKRVANA